MKRGYYTIMWNGRLWGKRNELPPTTPKASHHPKKVYGKTGRESSVMSSFWKIKWFIPTSTARK